jgi:Ca2+-binding RTX toxin-like protein
LTFTAARAATIVLTLAVVPALYVGVALCASNIVAGSQVSRSVGATDANTIKPSSCSGITLTTVVAGASGTGGADLLLGSSGPDTMAAAGGDDCVLGGGGNDTINCGGGTDVAIGGPGVDTFNNNCETQIQ